MSVQITGWHVEGFGVLNDYAVKDIPPGLTVFTGPNEAGKSTLLAFIRTMLFGFPTPPGSNGYYPPLRGGRHGGQLTVADSDGTSFTVDRQSGRRPPIVRRPDGEATEEDLRRLLGGCDRQLFQTVFAFDLADLQELEGLDHAGVRERLALVGISGSGASPTAAIAQLEQQRAVTLLASSGSSVEDLRGRIVDVGRTYETALREIDHARNLELKENDNADLLLEKGQELDRLGLQARHLRTLLQIWPDWTSKQDAEARRADIELDDAVHQSADSIEALSAEFDPFQIAVAELPRLKKSRDEVETTLAARLRDIGPEWDGARLLGAQEVDPKSGEVERFTAELQHADAELSDAIRSVIAAQADLTTHAKRIVEHEAKRSTLAAIVGERGIDERRVALRRLRALRSDLTSAEVQAQLEQASLEGLDELRLQSKRTTPSMPPGWLVAVALSILVAAAVGSVILFANGDVLIGLVVAAAVLGSLVLGLVLRSQTDRAERQRAQQEKDIATRIIHGRTVLEQRLSHHTTLRDNIAQNAATLGLSSLPSHTEIEEAEHRLSEAEDALQALDRQKDEIERVAEEGDNLSQNVEDAVRTRDQAEARRHEVLDQWAIWRAQYQLPAALDPAAAADFLALIDDGRQKAQELHNLEVTIAQTEQSIERVRQQIAALAPTVGISPEEFEAHLSDVLDQLQQRRANDLAARQSFAARDAEAAEATARITSVAGDDTRVWEALVEGAPETWARELHDVESVIVAVEEERLALSRRIGEDRAERQSIEQSQEIPNLNLQRSMLQAELDAAEKEDRITLVAELLIRETVQRIERDRQPEVLHRASSLFGRITEGRYQRVYQPVEGTGLEIEDLNGTTRPPEALSRGTLEQLYVALRLGLAEAFTDHVGALPLIMDDVLVNFDPDRARGVGQALFDVSSNRQVLIFTSQPATVQLLDDIGNEYGHFAMERHGAGGEWANRP